jgi:hypothetical protein
MTNVQVNVPDAEMESELHAVAGPAAGVHVTLTVPPAVYPFPTSVSVPFTGMLSGLAVSEGRTLNDALAVFCGLALSLPVTV